MLLDMSDFEAGLEAKRQGQDAVCIDTVSDSGRYVQRSPVAIPVVGKGPMSTGLFGAHSRLRYGNFITSAH